MGEITQGLEVILLGFIDIKCKLPAVGQIISKILNFSFRTHGKLEVLANFLIFRRGKRQVYLRLGGKAFEFC